MTIMIIVISQRPVSDKIKIFTPILKHSSHGPYLQFNWLIFRSRRFTRLRGQGFRRNVSFMHFTEFTTCGTITFALVINRTVFIKTVISYCEREYQYFFGKTPEKLWPDNALTLYLKRGIKITNHNEFRG